jgi:hypothetical protein
MRALTAGWPTPSASGAAEAAFAGDLLESGELIELHGLLGSISKTSMEDIESIELKHVSRLLLCGRGGAR